MKKIGFLVFLFTAYLNASSQIPLKTAVTYELAPGRFGDNLLSYIHAKWISYTYDIPLLYRPFSYSDQLELHDIELSYDEHIKQFPNRMRLDHNVTINPHTTKKMLYEVPYFPESEYEKKNGINFEGKPWFYFDIDWHDQNFISQLRKLIAPKDTFKKPSLPTDRITVAIHIRKGGNHDTPETIPLFPLKFLPIDFYITQLKKTYELLDEKPLYVCIFTDDNHPTRIAETFKKKLSTLNIQFDCREQGNSDTLNVLQDFFAMSEFDCLIHSESNYSFIMSKLNNYLISAYPCSFQKKGKTIVYNDIKISFNRNNQKTV